MAFHATPMFPGDLYDSALRLAASSEQGHHTPAANVASGRWQQMLTLGWPAVLVPEAAGGVGGTLADLAAVVEASARHAWAVPLIDRCALAPLVLAPWAAEPAVQALLEAIASGEASVATALDAAGRLPGLRNGLQPLVGGAFQGDLRGVDLSEPATHLLFNGTDAASGEAVLWCLPAAAWAARARCYAGVDGRRTADLSLDGLPVSSALALARGPAVLEAVTQAVQAGALLACVQGVGAAGAMIEQTIEYLGTRVQFGVQLATFQALRHRVVDMYVAFENASGLVRRLVEQGATGGPEARRESVLAKLYVANATRAVSESAIQLHGGMGMTWETPSARLAMHTLMGHTTCGDQAGCLDWLTAQSVAAAA
jgi:alkylation response protein AidB-like acyl-CoA dehydrogenase